MVFSNEHNTNDFSLFRSINGMADLGLAVRYKPSFALSSSKATTSSRMETEINIVHRLSRRSQGMLNPTDCANKTQFHVFSLHHH